MHWIQEKSKNVRVEECDRVRGQEESGQEVGKVIKLYVKKKNNIFSPKSNF